MSFDLWGSQRTSLCSYFIYREAAYQVLNLLQEVELVSTQHCISVFVQFLRGIRFKDAMWVVGCGYTQNCGQLCGDKSWYYVGSSNRLQLLVKLLKSLAVTLAGLIACAGSASSLIVYV